MIENQELYCHNCDKYVQFKLDTELNGRHVITCPNCGHEHYRYIDNGRISDRRWQSSNGNIQPSYQAQSWGFTNSATVTVSPASNSTATYAWTFQTYGNSSS